MGWTALGNRGKSLWILSPPRHRPQLCSKTLQVGPVSILYTILPNYLTALSVPCLYTLHPPLAALNPHFSITLSVWPRLDHFCHYNPRPTLARRVLLLKFLYLLDISSTHSSGATPTPFSSILPSSHTHPSQCLRELSSSVLAVSSPFATAVQTHPS